MPPGHHCYDKLRYCAREPDIFIVVCHKDVKDLVPNRVIALLLDARSSSPAVACRTTSPARLMYCSKGPIASLPQWDACSTGNAWNIGSWSIDRPVEMTTYGFDARSPNASFSVAPMSLSSGFSLCRACAVNSRAGIQKLSSSCLPVNPFKIPLQHSSKILHLTAPTGTRERRHLVR